MSSPRDQHALVIGAGLIGAAAATTLEALEEVGTVTVVDRDAGCAARVPRTVTVAVGDVTDHARRESLLAGKRPVDAAVLAGGLLPAAFAADPQRAHRRTLDVVAGSLALALAGGRRPHLVLCSSLAVYRDHRGADEEDRPGPRSAYGAAKLAAEDLASRVAAAAGAPLTVLRFCGVVGPARAGGGGWMHALLADTVRCPPPEVPAALVGQEYLHVRDAGRAIAAAVVRPPATAGPRVLNVGSGVVPGRDELARALDPTRRRDGPTGDPLPGLNSSRARAQTAFRPEYDTFPKILEGVLS